MLIGNEYGKRLNRKSRNLRPGALDRLVAEYPDHGFVIDRTEAEGLFYRVREATAAERVLSNELGTLGDVGAGRKAAFIGFLNGATASDAQTSSTEGANDATVAGRIAQPADGTEKSAQVAGAGVSANAQPAANGRP